MRLLRTWLLLALIGLWLGGCLEMIRRNPEHDPAGPWTDPGNQSEQTDVQEVEAQSPEQTAGAPAGPEPVANALASAADGPASDTQRPERSSPPHQTVGEINEYAFWCIENGMWNEARTHLEQGLQQDSLAASLHNNLGVVYERLGLPDQAAAAYKKARSLDRSKKAYRINLELFEGRGKPDSSRVKEQRDERHRPGSRRDSAGPRMSPGE